MRHLVPFAAALLLSARPGAQEVVDEPPLAPEGEPEAPAEVPETDTGPLTRADLEAWLDGFMPYALTKGGVAGTVVVVVGGGDVVLAKGYGYSDLATRTPVDSDTTLFRPGSASKLFTWTAVMQQVEQGRIDPDRDVNEYLDFVIPARAGDKPVTMRHIMTHTPGFEERLKKVITPDPDNVRPLGW